MEIDNIFRADHRNYDQLRNLKVTYNIYPYAAGSVLFELGNTKVLCSVTLQPGVPSFLKGSKAGWLTSEYNMLPASTHVRSVREISTLKRNNRNIEISRFLGRALRSVVQLDQLGESTIIIDCDVLQADGGTRVASLCGAYLAIKSNNFLSTLLKDEIAAVSLGLKSGVTLLDLDYKEDSNIDSDFTYVLTRSGKIIEVLGSSERLPFSWQEYSKINELALKGASDIFYFYDNNLK